MVTAALVVLTGTTTVAAQDETERWVRGERADLEHGATGALRSAVAHGRGRGLIHARHGG